MKQHLLIYTLLIVFGWTTQAQNEITIEPAPPATSLMTTGEAAGTDDPMNPDYYVDYVAHAFIKNNTNQDLTIGWVRTLEDFPSNKWESQICDPILCWGPTQGTSSETFTIRAGGSGTLDVHFLPYDDPGSGAVEVHVYAVNDSANINVTARFTTDVFITSVAAPIVQQPLRLYPNPVITDLTIDFGTTQNVELVEVYNLIGRQMAAYTVPFGLDKFQVPTDRLDAGIYFVSLYDKKRDLITTKRFSKVK